MSVDINVNFRGKYGRHKELSHVYYNHDIGSHPKDGVCLYYYSMDKPDWVFLKVVYVLTRVCVS